MNSTRSTSTYLCEVLHNAGVIPKFKTEGNRYGTRLKGHGNVRLVEIDKAKLHQFANM